MATKIGRVVLKMCLSVILIGIVVVSVGCSPSRKTTYQNENIVLTKEAPVPPGVARYCWEEPMVKLEQNGPGLDSEGKWYHPSYTAVREVRMGKWRPCERVVSEVEGGMQHER